MHALRVALLLLTLCATHTARAGNDDELLVGTRAAMTGGAVSAKVSDGSAIWYNPGGLGAITRAQVDVSGTVYTLRLYSAPELLGTADGERREGSVTEFVSVPNQITFVRGLGRGVTLGLGYFVPRAQSFRLREQLDAGDAQDGSQWQLALGVADAQHTAAAALGLSLSPFVRVGVALIGSYQTIVQSSSFAGVVRQDGRPLRLVTSSSLATLDRIGAELGAGVQLDLAPRVHLGLGMRSPRVMFHSGVDSAFTTVMLPDGAADAPDLQVELAGLEDGDGTLRLLLAGRFGASIAYDYAEHSYVALEADVQPGLRTEAAGVDREAVANARLGVFHALSPGVALGAGLFTDRSADVLRGDEVISAFGDFYGGSLGLELSSGHRLADGEPSPSLVFSTTFALRYAFSASKLNGAISDPEAPIEEWFRPLPGELIAHELGFYVGSGLQF